MNLNLGIEDILQISKRLAFKINMITTPSTYRFQLMLRSPLSKCLQLVLVIILESLNLTNYFRQYEETKLALRIEI